MAVDIGTLEAHIRMRTGELDRDASKARRTLGQLETSAVGSFSTMGAAVGKLGALIGVTFAGTQVLFFLKNAEIGRAHV